MKSEHSSSETRAMLRIQTSNYEEAKYSQIAYKFKEGRENMRDIERRGRPQTHRSDANVATNAIVPAPTKPVSHNTDQDAGSSA
jgi:hypothetical protein